MTNLRTGVFTLFLALTVALMFGCGGDDKKNNKPNDNKGRAGGGGNKVLRFSAIPDQDTVKLKEKFDAWARYLSNELGVKVEFVPAKDYSASVEMFRNGDIQLAWFGGLTGVQARQAVPGAHAIAMGEADGKFVSYFIAHKDTGLTRSEKFPLEMGKLTFMFGSPQSTSGRLMPAHYIQQESGKPVDEFFEKKPQFSGSHDNTLKAVLSGGVQAGVLNYSLYDKRVKEDPSIAQTAPIVWVTPMYADYNFTAHPDLEKMFGQGFIDKLQKALINTTDPALLAAFPRKKLVIATDADFAGIEKVAKNLGMLR